MNLNDLKKNWNQFGKIDPYWAILTHPQKKGKLWDEEDFFETGRKWVDLEVDRLLQFKPNFSFGSALDFGCGAGRLTQGAADYFEKAIGVDIAPSMIQLANEKNKRENCKFILNDINDLSVFKNEKFDFLYSILTLQHMKPKYAKKYVSEFLRVLKPDGIAVFQIPSKPDAGTLNHHKVSNLLKNRALRILKPKSTKDEVPIMEMHWIPIQEMVSFLIEEGAQILTIKSNNAAGENWQSYIYRVCKTSDS